ncbi:hypothetical protein HPG69_014667 [Diceros bicornis minor]|uniref:Nucleoside-diphosphate kinase n=1 Tax=Diceros bicornis minor TaxID=77932 RepID=A0A7J7EZA6_DICBM|nr:hypothetical protein HPG69_014667 [Diceros bicornis minor]
MDKVDRRGLTWAGAGVKGLHGCLPHRVWGCAKPTFSSEKLVRAVPLNSSKSFGPHTDISCRLMGEIIMLAHKTFLAFTHTVFCKSNVMGYGWILDGIPESREQALMIQTLGITPRHVIVLSAPDTVLIERNLGKRVDPQTGEIYHTTFDWPPEPEIQNRLMVPGGISELETAGKLLEYHRNIVRILPSYSKILKVISADQPCMDVFYQALTYVQTNRRSNAPFTPRVLLCGPVGSGKSLQAALLAQKYGLVNVCCGHLLKEAVAEKSKFGEMIQPFFEKDTAECLLSVTDNI